MYSAAQRSNSPVCGTRPAVTKRLAGRRAQGRWNQEESGAGGAQSRDIRSAP